MVWTGTEWNVADGGFGGQPGVALNGRALSIKSRAPHGPKPEKARWACLTFVAPQDGDYLIEGTAKCRMWDSDNKTNLLLLHHSGAGVREVGKWTIPNNNTIQLTGKRVHLSMGQELSFLPMIEGMYAGGACDLTDLKISLAKP